MEVCRFFQFADGGAPVCDGGNGAGSNGQTCRSQLGTDLLGWLDSLHSAVLVTHVYRGLSMLCSIQIIAAAAAAAAATMATAVRSIQNTNRQTYSRLFFLKSSCTELLK